MAKRPNAKSARLSQYTLDEWFVIQLHLNRVSDEALGRYMSEPRNAEKIGQIFKETYLKLKVLQRVKPRGDQPGDQDRCPDGSKHYDCRCSLDARGTQQQRGKGGSASVGRSF